MATDLKKSKRKAFRPSSEPELTWEIARLFPAQGEWSEEEYFALDNNHRVEYSDGFLEFLPMPTIFHQLILQYLYGELKAFITAGCTWEPWSSQATRCGCDRASFASPISFSSSRRTGPVSRSNTAKRPIL